MSLLVSSLLSSVVAFAPLPPISDVVKGFERREGFIENYLDRSANRIYFKFPATDSNQVGQSFLYAEGLTSGLGVNDIGLDRGSVGDSQVIHTRIRGAKLFFEAENTNIAASSQNPEEINSVLNSFPKTVFWVTNLVAKDPDGSILVDMTDFLVRDVHGVGRTLPASAGYSFDSGRSTLMAENCFSFPKNLELDALISFSSARGSGQIGQVSAASTNIGFIQHHSFVELPAPGYKMRELDPRMGYFGIEKLDFSSPINKPLAKRWIAKHRLEKINPGTAPSEVKKPIVYYLDRATPEPIRSALIEGAQWWSKAFEDAGFRNAYRVELMPEGMHPLDIRYNVIQWVHRSTRGFSIGASISDPRTGEIIKGAVRLDSSRGRQDMKIFDGIFGAAISDDMTPLALARLRQLSAHEVGHTLGLAHNFAGSTYAGRASVMDYPAPLLRLVNNRVDFSNAYGVGVGAWDCFAIKVGYAEFGNNERQEIQRLLSENTYLYLTDQDAPNSGGSDWRSTRFDNGNDPVADLKNSLEIREYALKNFGAGNLHRGIPRSELDELLGPIYFYHRYSLDATLKLIGGALYRHEVAGDPNSRSVEPISAEKQREALDILFEAMHPKNLKLRPELLSILNPSSPGAGRSAERFKSNTTFVFDGFGAAQTAADMVLSELLLPARAVRMIELRNRTGTGTLSLEELLTRITGFVFGLKATDSSTAEIIRGIRSLYFERLLDLADAEVPRTVHSRVLMELNHIVNKLSVASNTKNELDRIHMEGLRKEFLRYQQRPASEAKRVPKPLAPMPGSPIGCSCP